MKKIAFTICSINYLAQAKTLGDSLTKHNPDYIFYICLVDILSKANLDITKLPIYNLVEVGSIGIEGFDDMYDRYNIVELNTAIKPFCFKYFYDLDPKITTVSYFDPDIEVFQPLTTLDESLTKHSLVITPHILSPYFDNLLPNENDILNTGVFNLGFLGSSRSVETDGFLKWWQARLQTQCYMDIANGMFVDQLWVSYAPIFWEKMHIDKHYGYNMAYWNLHERKLTGLPGQLTVNDIEPLVFFHFSGFNPNDETVVSKYQNRHTFETNKDVEILFRNYTSTLHKNDYDYFRQFKCAYMKPAPTWMPPKRGQRPRKWLIAKLNALIDFIKEF